MRPRGRSPPPGAARARRGPPTRRRPRTLSPTPPARLPRRLGGRRRGRARKRPASAPVEQAAGAGRAPRGTRAAPQPALLPQAAAAAMQPLRRRRWRRCQLRHRAPPPFPPSRTVHLDLWRLRKAGAALDLGCVRRGLHVGAARRRCGGGAAGAAAVGGGRAAAGRGRLLLFDFDGARLERGVEAGGDLGVGWVGWGGVGGVGGVGGGVGWRPGMARGQGEDRATGRGKVARPGACAGRARVKARASAGDGGVGGAVREGGARAGARA
jgi:hypothetical protein